MLVTFDDLDAFSAPTSKTASLDIDRYSAIYGESKAAQILFESQESEVSAIKHFDVFLSHCYADVRLNRKRIIQLKKWLETKHSLTVYIDWINDPLLSRSAVSRATAETLRQRMRQSDCLFFATSETSSSSKWMPWELGFKDAHRNRHGYDGRCAILPISQATSSQFKGSEYLGLHPFVEEDTTRLILSPQPKTSTSKSVLYRTWVMLGNDPV